MKLSKRRSNIRNTRRGGHEEIYYIDNFINRSWNRSIFGYRALTKDGDSISQIFKAKTYDVYEAGDVVEFGDESWYVMYDSDKSTDYVTLISKNIIYLEDEDLSIVVNGIYETSKVNEYLKNEYAKVLGEDNLVERNGYKVRLFNNNDFDNLITASYDKENDEYTITDCPEFICLTNTFFATMIDTNTDIEFIDVYNNVNDIENILYDEYTLHLKYYNLSSTYDTNKLVSLVDNATLFIRPVVNVYKESLKDN